MKTECLRKRVAYSLVSTPEHNFDPESIIFSSPPKFGDIYYSGFFRAPFIDIDLKRIRHNLPREIEEKYTSVHYFENKSRYGYAVTNSLEDVKVMKAFTESLEKKSSVEIIGLDSNYLRSSLDLACDNIELVFLGYDYAERGGYSGLLRCFFEYSEHFSEQIRNMNENGLLNTSKQVEDLINRYDELQNWLDFEKTEMSQVDIVGVYRIKGTC